MLAVLLLVAGEAPLLAAESSGLPLPRFVSLRAKEAKLRTGPGVQYPEDWVYLRKDIPLEIIAEHHTWRKVRDWQGTQGWMHQSLVSGKRTLMVTGAIRTVRSKPDSASRAVARAEAGVVGFLLGCPGGSGWCQVEIGGFKGWLRRVEFWGVYPDETVE
jgi:SH3-like domain-containing protein